MEDKRGRWLRRFRGCLYRLLPASVPGSHRFRTIGFARRWSLEEKGGTLEGFARLLWAKVLNHQTQGRILECSCGDGLVGSLGRWLEEHAQWRSDCHESRTLPRRQLSQNRPQAVIHPDLGFLRGLPAFPEAAFDLVTTRSFSSGSRLCRWMRESRNRPGVVGIWNRTGTALWSGRLGRMGYRMVLCWDRMEFYQKT